MRASLTPRFRAPSCQLTDVPKQKLITPSIISEKLKVNGSLARKACRELVSKNLIRARHSMRTRSLLHAPLTA